MGVAALGADKLTMPVGTPGDAWGRDLWMRCLGRLALLFALTCAPAAEATCTLGKLTELPVTMENAALAAELKNAAQG